MVRGFTPGTRRAKRAAWVLFGILFLGLIIMGIVLADRAEDVAPGAAVDGATSHLRTHFDAFGELASCAGYCLPSVDATEQACPTAAESRYYRARA